VKTRVRSHIAGARPLAVSAAPVIYAGVVPLLPLDVFVSLCRATGFPAYGIGKVAARIA
jgi:hypothetical protein